MTAASKGEHGPEVDVEDFMNIMAQSREDWEAYKKVCEAAAVRFLDECSLEPTPEAVHQLTEGFLPCLAIICQRGYDPNGASWQQMGWRGLLMETGRRWHRMHYNSWQRGKYDPNNCVDLVNFTTYLFRSRHEISQWGYMGEPGGSQ